MTQGSGIIVLKFHRRRFSGIPPQQVEERGLPIHQEHPEIEN